MQPRIHTAVIPIAGLGTRLLPATKSVPKELLNVVDKPVIDYVVDEARAAGIERFVFVTGRGKSAVEDHFDVAFEVEETLRRRGKMAEAEALRLARPAPGQMVFTRQQNPDGLGHAIACARHFVGNEPFAVLLPDVIVQNREGPGYLSQLVSAYREFGGTLIAVERVPRAEVSQYGIVSLAGPAIAGLGRVDRLVEKPSTQDAPSDLAIVGRYILQPTIFDHIAGLEAGAGGEIQLTDALQASLASESAYALTCKGRTFDCGSKIGLLAANVALALARSDLGGAFGDALTDIIPNASHDLMRRVIAVAHGLPQGSSSGRLRLVA